MALAVTAAVVPFPGGLVAAAPAAAIVGVCLSTANLPRALLTLFVGSDPTAAADYRPVCDSSGNVLKWPVGEGGFFPLPANLIPVGAKIQVGLENFGGASATVNLVTS